MRRNQEIKELTGIRFFAALHVVLFHNLYLLGDSRDKLPSFFLTIVSYGDSAVALFFILSGFILTYVYEDKGQLNTSKKKFYIARISRLYPVYMLGLIMDIPRGVSYFTHEYQLNQALTKIGISIIAYTSMLQSWYPRVTATWNSPAWSLSVEAFFYIVFPLFLPWLFKLKSSFRLLSVLYIIPVLLFYLVNFFGSLDFSDPFIKTLWRSFPLIRLNEFLIGIVLAKIFIRHESMRMWFEQRRGLASLFFWVSVLGSFILVTIDLPILREIRTSIFLTPIFSLMIVSLAYGNIIFTSWLKNRFLLVLGGASYSLYILHQPLLSYVSWFSQSKGLTIFIAYLFLSILISVLVFKKLEIPLQRIIRKRWMK